MRLRWTVPAFQDFSHICDYTDMHFGKARGRRTALQIQEAAESLTSFPHMGSSGRKSGTYELAMSGLPFVIVYCLKDDVVEVLRVLHGAQKWP